MILNVLPIIPQLGKNVSITKQIFFIKAPFALSLEHVAQNSNYLRVYANSIIKKENKTRKENPTFEDVVLHASLAYLF